MSAWQGEAGAAQRYCETSEEQACFRFDSFFVTAFTIIDATFPAPALGPSWRIPQGPSPVAVLYADELGEDGPDATKVLFPVVNARCPNQRLLLFTTNKPINDRGVEFHNCDPAETDLDRAFERAPIIPLEKAVHAHPTLAGYRR